MNATNIIIYLYKKFIDFYFLVKIRVLHVARQEVNGGGGGEDVEMRGTSAELVVITPGVDSGWRWRPAWRCSRRSRRLDGWRFSKLLAVVDWGGVSERRRWR
jgi:hypothetical protein